MKLVSVTITFLLISVLSFSQNNGQIITSTPVVYPAYENIKGISSYYDKKDYIKVITDKTLVTEKIVYYSKDPAISRIRIEP